MFFLDARNHALFLTQQVFKHVMLTCHRAADKVCKSVQNQNNKNCEHCAL